MKDRILQGHMVGGQAGHSLVQAIERGDQLSFRVVRNVQLKSQPHPVRFPRRLATGLPRGKNCVAWFFAPRRLFRDGISTGIDALPLRPVCRQCSRGPGKTLPSKRAPNRSELQFQIEIRKRNRTRFDREDALFQAVQRRAKRAVSSPLERCSSR